jgi:pathogenesis-related protein 1
MQPRVVVLTAGLLLLACKRTQDTTGAVVAPERSPQTNEPRARPIATRDAETGKLAGLTAAHNRLRAEVHVGPLSWSNEIGRWASAWAQQLAAHGCQLAHRPAGADRYGENIFWSSDAVTSSAVVAQWAAERASYHHAGNRCDGVCGHFTQMVWRASTKLGCGMASCPGGGEIWVCNYDPPGNMMGESPY